MEAHKAFKTLNPNDPFDNKLVGLLDEDIREFFNSMKGTLHFVMY